MKENRKICCSSVCGGITLALGIILLPMTYVLVDAIVKKAAVLTPGSVAYPVWVEVPVPFVIQFWVWDIQNPDQVLQGAKPVLKQKGPYSWDERRPKVEDSIIHNDNGTVTFRSKKTYTFNRERSVGPQTDTFTTVDLPVFVVAYLLRYQPARRKALWNVIHQLSGATPLVTLTVEEFVFGYEYEYLKLAQDVLGEEIIPHPELGLFLNNSGDGLWNVFTGEKGIQKLNLIDRWNGRTELPYWTTPYANMLNGSDGTLHPPFVDKNDIFYAYVPTGCRSGAAVFEKERKMGRIPVYHYVQPDWLFASPAIYPDNVGFCTPDKYTCPPSGLLNATNCLFHAPIFLSSPHFLYTEQSVLDMIEGPEPDINQHRIEVDVDPISGATVQAYIRAQVNLYIQSYDFVSGLEKMPEAYFPLIWQNESAAMTDDDLHAYFLYTRLPLIFVVVITSLLLAGGVGLLVWLGFILYKKNQQEKLTLIKSNDMDLNLEKDNPEVQVEEGETKEAGDNNNNSNSATTVLEVL